MPENQHEIKLPGSDRGIPLWILIGGGVLIVGFIVLTRQGKSDTTTGSDNTGLLAAELDTRMNDIWNQIFNLLDSQMGYNNDIMPGPGPIIGYTPPVPGESPPYEIPRPPGWPKNAPWPPVVPPPVQNPPAS